MSLLRTRWAAVGAAVAVTLGGGGLGLVDAAKGSGERNVYTAIQACRLIDTRPTQGIGGRTSPLGPGEILELDTHGSNGQCTGIPGDANALGLNVTAVFPTELTHLTFFTGSTVPNSSSLNPAPGEPPTPNAVTVALAGDGTFKVFNNSGSVHLIIDIVGYYQHHHHDDRYYTEAQTRALVFNGTIPSGMTVRGNAYWDSHGSTDTFNDAVSVDFPGRAPVPLSHDLVNFNQPGVTGDGDPQCTGSATAPTAPAGKVCIYAWGFGGLAASSLNGYAGIPMNDAGFLITWNPSGTDDVDQYLIASWAYTAP